MQPVSETRRQRLKQLIAQYGTIAALNTALGWDTTNARLSQIQNASIRSGRGTPYEMGDTTAREIEAKLGLTHGWMDTPPGFEALEEPGTRQLLDLFGQLKPEDRAKAVRLLDALTEPARNGPANGTTG